MSIVAAVPSPLPSAADPTGWDAFVERHPLGHVLQLSGWGTLKARFGWEVEHVALPGGDAEPSAAALLLLQRRLGLTLGYVPRGPLVDWQNMAQVQRMLDALAQTCRRRGASLLKVEPELPDTPEHRALLLGLGLRPSAQTIQPRSTVVVDISGSEEAILARMKSKWRYNVRLAQRKGVAVRACRRADLPAVHALMAETAQRDAFDVHDPAYYDAAFDLLTPEHGAFLLAEFEGQPLAMIAVCAVGQTAWYLWGASSDRERSRMPNHALQWAGMQWARARAAQRYDLWGIPDALGQLAQGLRNGDGRGTPCDAMPVDVETLPGTGLWGVYRFKQGFGGDVVRYVGAWDLPLRAAGYAVYRAGLKALAAKRALDQRLAARAEGAPAREAVVQPVRGQAEWQRTLAALPLPHVLQSWEWGAVKAQTGWQAERLALRGGKAAFQFLTRRPLPLLPLRIGYVPKGPIWEWSDRTTAMAALEAIEAHARARRCVLVKIDPDVAEGAPEGVWLQETLRRRGWRFSREQIQFKNTACTDLSAGEDALLAGMKSKWRYNVRLAERRGLSVRLGTPADFAGFYALYAETGRRDGFLIRPFDYYRLTWETFLRAQAEPENPAGGALLLAEHPEEAAPVAGLFLLKYGATAWYFYGASSERRRRDMPNHLLQWEALRWAQAQGCTRYDWWGAPTDPEDAADPMQGVWGFKQGFGAQLQEHVGAWDYAVSPLLYRAYAEALPRVQALLRRRHDAQAAQAAPGG